MIIKDHGDYAVVFFILMQATVIKKATPYEVACLFCRLFLSEKYSRWYTFEIEFLTQTVF